MVGNNKVTHKVTFPGQYETVWFSIDRRSFGSQRCEISESNDESRAKSQGVLRT